LRVFVETTTRARVDEARLARLARRVLLSEEKRDCDLTVVLVDNAYIRNLNRRWLKRNAPTDVLAFSMAMGPDAAYNYGVLGDVYISLEKAREQAGEYGVSFEEELARLVVHGVLHLAGYDHKKPSDARRMRSREEACLRTLAPPARKSKTA
jgi:probable rRNA maturation factor